MSGYILFDCGGLNLNSSSKQTITGIYNRAKEALATGKLVLATNCNMSGMECSPVAVVAWDQGTDGIIATGHVLRIVIGSDDGATVTNLVAG